MNPRNWSLKARVTWSFMAVVLCVSLALSLLYYRSQRMQYEENLARTDRNDVTYLMGNVEKQLRLCEKLSDWIYVNRSIQTSLVRDYSQDMDQYNREIPPIQRLIADQLVSSSVGEYIIFLIIQGNNGIALKSNTDSYWVEDLAEETWYAHGRTGGGSVLWTGIHENPASYRSSQYVVPIVRPIIFSDTRAEIGWHALAFSPALIADVFEDYHMDSARSILVLDRDNRAVFHQDPAMVGKVMEYDFLEGSGEWSGSRVVELDGRRMMVTGKQSEHSGMTVLLLHSLEGLEQQVAFTRSVLIGLVALTAAMFLLLTYYLSNRLTKPLGGILKRLRLVADGVFEQDPAIEGNDEMGLIGRGVNEMTANIVSLMDELIHREHERCELEYRVLLNQINPHFVYNVLNSIKVMADIQKIEGISEMAASLGMLLKEISKGKAEQVTIRRELELLESYLYLQKIRRCGLLTVRYDIPDESVRDDLIPRFTLQPLAENAVYHGLDKQNRMGMIDISIRTVGEDLVIVLQDNGAGIPPERVAALMENDGDSGGEEFTHVGLQNVDKRIKLFCGGGGLSIESEEGSYTRVIVRMPRRR